MSTKLISFMLPWTDPLSANGNYYAPGTIARVETSIADRAIDEGNALFIDTGKVLGRTALVALGTAEVSAGDIINLLYRDTVGDDGGGLFEVIAGTAAANSLTEDDGIVYENTGGTLTFRRLETGVASPMWFGAVADGDEANADADTQACIDAMLSGRSVDFGPNTNHYRINSPLAIANKTEAQYFGRGAKLSVVTGYTSFYLFNLTGNNIHVKLYGLHLDMAGFGTSYVTNKGIGIRITGSPFTEVHHCTFTGFATHAIRGEEIGGTGAREEGVRIYDNHFEDFTDSGDTQQVAVWLKDNCEYSVVERNTFHDLPRAIRMEDGANSRITGNVIQGCFGTNWTGSAIDTTVALVWIGSNSNYGKITVSENTFNHNEYDVVPLIIKGDATKPQNVNRVSNNQFVVNGSTNIQEQVMLFDAPSNSIHGNSFRANGSNTHNVITLTDSDGCIIYGNYFDRGLAAVSLVNSKLAQIFSNTNGATTYVDADATSSVAYSERKSVGIRVVSNGNEGSPWPLANMTVTRASTGVFEITHNLATDSPNNDEITLTIMPELEDIIPFVDYTTDTTKITVTLKDGAGTLTNATFRGIMDVPPLIPLKNMHD